MRVDGIKENSLFSKGLVSKYGGVLCLSLIWVRIGLIGGVGIKMDSSVTCVVGHGGYCAVLMETKSISRDGI